jgi:hypothetical protein
LKERPLGPLNAKGGDRHKKAVRMTGTESWSVIRFMPIRASWLTGFDRQASKTVRNAT